MSFKSMNLSIIEELHLAKIHSGLLLVPFWSYSRFISLTSTKLTARCANGLSGSVSRLLLRESRLHVDVLGEDGLNPLLCV